MTDLPSFHIRNTPLIHDEQVFLACSCGWWTRKDISRLTDWEVCKSHAKGSADRAWIDHIENPDD